MTDIHAFEPLWENWVVDGMIGRGSYGTVWKAHREDQFTHVRQFAAVKHIPIPPEGDQAEIDIPFSSERAKAQYYRTLLDQLIVEIDAMVSLRGKPGIVAYEEHKVVPKPDNAGYDLFIRMELLRSVPRYIRETNRPLSRQEVLRLGVDIAEALEALESRNLVHRDIKPDNIFIDNDGRFKLGDFGTSRALEETGNATTKTGTPNYMAPEVFTKALQYDQTVDIYSLGIMLYRYMNNGFLPFMSETEVSSEKALARRIRGEALKAPCNADAALSGIILRACAYRPEDRYRNAADLKRDLLRLSESPVTTPVFAAPPAPPAAHAEAKPRAESRKEAPAKKSAKKKGSRRKKVFLAAAAAVLLLACAGTAVYLLARPSPAPAATGTPEIVTASGSGPVLTEKTIENLTVSVSPSAVETETASFAALATPAQSAAESAPPETPAETAPATESAEPAAETASLPVLPVLSEICSGSGAQLKQSDDPDFRYPSRTGPGTAFVSCGGYKPSKKPKVTVYLEEDGWVLSDVRYTGVEERVVWLPKNSFASLGDVPSADGSAYWPGTATAGAAPSWGPDNRFNSVASLYVAEGSELKVFFQENGFVYAEYACAKGTVRMWIPADCVAVKGASLTPGAAPAEPAGQSSFN